MDLAFELSRYTFQNPSFRGRGRSRRNRVNFKRGSRQGRGRNGKNHRAMQSDTCASDKNNDQNYQDGNGSGGSRVTV